MSDGNPEQILAKAIEEIQKFPPTNAMVIAWYSQSQDGSGIMRYLHSSADGPSLTALTSDLAFELHISRRSIFGRNPAVDVVYPIQKGFCIHGVDQLESCAACQAES